MLVADYRVTVEAGSAEVEIPLDTPVVGVGVLLVVLMAEQAFVEAEVTWIEMTGGARVPDTVVGTVIDRVVLRVVVETHGLPIVQEMTLLAVGREACRGVIGVAGARVVVGVAGKAVHGRVVESIRGVAVQAFETAVPLLQRERRMIDRSRIPGVDVMTEFAG